MLSRRKTFLIDSPDLFQHLIHQIISECHQRHRLVLQILQLMRQGEFNPVQLALQRSGILHFPAVWIQAEEFEISTEVENIEILLIRTVQQALTQPCPPADHLPEFRFAHHLLEKHQVQHFRHINSRIQHVHGNRNLRQLLRIGEGIDGLLRILNLIVDDLRIAGQLRIFLVKYF